MDNDVLNKNLELKRKLQHKYKRFEQWTDLFRETYKDSYSLDNVEHNDFVSRTHSFEDLVHNVMASMKGALELYKGTDSDSDQLMLRLAKKSSFEIAVYIRSLNFLRKRDSEYVAKQFVPICVGNNHPGSYNSRISYLLNEERKHRVD